MRIVFVGTGDAFATDARAHTCFRLESDGRVVVVDFGAAALVNWRRLGLTFNDVEAVIVSHLHGDHFGGLPFLLLESQYIAERVAPLEIIGPPGLRARLSMAMDAFFPGLTAAPWRFPWRVRELAAGETFAVAGFEGRSAPAHHAAGAPATSLRLSANGKTFAYSGDTAWTDHLLDVARDADLFVCECYAAGPGAPGHMDWETLRARLPDLAARRVLLTHMSAPMLARAAEVRAAGLDLAEDGLTLDL